MKKITTNFLTLLVVVVVLANSISFANAYVVIDGQAPTIIADTTTPLKNSTVEDEENAITLLESIKDLTYRAAGDYYVVFEDATKASDAGYTDGESITFSFDDIDASTGTTTSRNVTATVIVTNDLSNTTLRADAIKPNSTVFFTPGTYIASKAAYTRFSHYNNTGTMNNGLAIIGVNVDGTPTTLGDVVFHTYRYSDGNERNIIGQNGVYFSNIVFECQSVGMTNTSSRHRYLLHVNGSNVAFDNVKVRNLTSGILSGSHNVAINVLNGTNVVFNDLHIDNSRAKAGYGIIQVNLAQNTYFNNITFTNMGTYSGQWFKAEQPETALQETEDVTIYVTGKIDATFGTTSGFRDNVYVEKYSFDTVAFPKEYRYGRLSSTATGGMTIHRSKPAQSTSYAILDLYDNSFIIDASSTDSNLNSQMQALVNALSRGMLTRNTDYIDKPQYTSAKTFNVKYTVTDAAKNVQLPNIAATGTLLPLAVFINFNIIPVTDATDLITNSDLLVFDDTTDVINLNATSATRYKIYNFDFDTKAKATLHEVIYGVVDGAVTVIDPYESIYPSSNDLKYAEYLNPKDGLVFNSSIDTFVNCRFTALVQEIAINPSHTNPLIVGDSLQLDANLSSNVGNSFTLDAYNTNSNNKDSAADRPLEIEWYSTDTSVATVDSNGLVSIVGAGNATIVAKAADSLNEGEIEKPYAIYQISADAKSPPPDTGVESMSFILYGTLLTSAAIIYIISSESKKRKVA